MDTFIVKLSLGIMLLFLPMGIQKLTYRWTFALFYVVIRQQLVIVWDKALAARLNFSRIPRNNHSVLK